MEKQEIKKVEPQQIQRVEIPADAPLLTRMAMMMENGVNIDVDQMSKMYELSERVSAGEAKKAFAADFTVAQSNIGAVVKGKWNPQTKSHYADLSSVIEMTKPVYTKENFSVTFYEGVTEVTNHIRVCADVLHADGHSKPYHYDVPLGGKGIAGKVNMTAIHAKATSVTYGQRYLMTMIWNIPTQDVDGNLPTNAPEPPVFKPITADEFEVLDAICEGIRPAEPGFVINKKRIGSLLLERNRAGLVMSNVEKASEWVMKFGDHDLYEPINPDAEIPGEFEEQDASGI